MSLSLEPRMLARAAAFSAAIVCFSATASAQTVLERELALVNTMEPNAATWETSLAVGEDRVIALSHVRQDTVTFIGYALAEPDGDDWTWTEEGIIDPDADELNLSEPTIAYDRVTGDFLACAIDAVLPHRIMIARFDAHGDPPGFGAWECVGECDPNSAVFDRSSIVAGEVILALDHDPGFGPFEPLLDSQEFYITWKGDGDWHYLRSIDGGSSWVGGAALKNLGNPNSTIAVSWPQPRVHDDGPLYVEYLDVVSRTLGFVRGVDVNSGSHNGKVQFSVLRNTEEDPNNPGQYPPLAIKLHANPVYTYLIIPGPASLPGLNVAIAYKDPNATSFQANQELCDDPPNCNDVDPALDFGLNISGFELRDYIGIAAGTDRVFTSFMGASTKDTTTNNKSLIWASEILFP